MLSDTSVKDLEVYLPAGISNIMRPPANINHSSVERKYEIKRTAYDVRVD